MFSKPVNSEHQLELPYQAYPMHKHRDKGRCKHLGEILIIQFCTLWKEDKIGESKQEILEAHDLNIETM